MVEGYSENERDIDLQEISVRYSSESKSDFKYAMGRVAKDLVEGNSLSISDLSVNSLLSTRNDRIRERYFSPIEKQDLKTIEFEIARYVLNSAISEEPEDIVNYNNFFLLKPDLNEDAYNNKDWRVDRVTAALSILDILKENHQEEPALTQKLFYDTYLESLQSVRERDVPLLDIDLAWHLIYLFEKVKKNRFISEKSKFYNEQNIGVVREEAYQLIDKIFKVTDPYFLAEKNKYLSQMLSDLFASSWFLNDNLEERFLENRELQDSMLKGDIKARRLKRHDENFVTPLTIVQENIDGYEREVEEIRRPKVLKSVTNIFTVLERMKPKGDNAELYERDEELSENIRDFMNYYRSDYSKVLVSVLSELTEIDSSKTREVFLPMVNGLMNEINWFYQTEVSDSNRFISNTVRSYMAKLGKEDSKISSKDQRVQLAAFIKKKIREKFQPLRFESLASEEVVIEEIEIFDEEKIAFFKVEKAVKKVGVTLKFDKKEFKKLIDNSKVKTERILDNYEFVRELLRLYGSEYKPEEGN